MGSTARRRRRTPSPAVGGRAALQCLRDFIGGVSQHASAAPPLLSDTASLQALADSGSLSAADEASAGRTLSAMPVHLFPDTLIGPAAALGGSLAGWHCADPLGALYFCGGLISLTCTGGQAAAVAVDVCRAIVSTTRAASSARVALWTRWPTLLLGDGGLARLLAADAAATRAAAADAVTSLMRARPALATRAAARSTPARAFTPPALRAAAAANAVCDALADAVRAEGDSPALASMARAAAALAEAAAPPVLAPAALTALIVALVKRAGDRNLEHGARAAAATAAASALAECAEHLECDATAAVIDLALSVLREHSEQGTPPAPLAETLTALAAAAGLHSIAEDWSKLAPHLRGVTKGPDDVLILHVVRVVERALSAVTKAPTPSPAEADWATDVYTTTVLPLAEHGFHAVRSAVALCGEHALRLAAVDVRGITNVAAEHARDALIYAVLTDSVDSVRCVAARGLSAAPGFLVGHAALIAAVQTVVIGNASVGLQARCAWTLAALVGSLDLSNTNNNPIAEGCLRLATAALSDRQVELTASVRNADRDTRVTGYVRLAGAALKYMCASGTGERTDREDEVDQAVAELSSCAADAKEAPKARWNAAFALENWAVAVGWATGHSAAAEHAAGELVRAALPPGPAKVRAAAARARCVFASSLGQPIDISSAVRVYSAASLETAAPRAQCDALVAAAATMLHDALADATDAAAAEAAETVGEATLLIDAVAAVADIPAYALRPRAELPPSADSADRPEAVLAALAPKSKDALRRAVKAAGGFVKGSGGEREGDRKKLIGLAETCEHVSRLFP